jgi:hypothetical protein
MNPSHIDAPRERILRGKDHWWFLGPGGVARLRAHHLTPEGNLRPDAERFLRDQGLFAVRPASIYALTVLTSTDCNLGCGYCFQNIEQDPTGGNRRRASPTPGSRPPPSATSSTSRPARWPVKGWRSSR